MSQRILLMGSPRSGTTWIGRMLGHAPGAAYIDEPDLVEAPLTGAPGRHGFGPYPVIDPGERSLRALRFATLWDLAFANASPRRRWLLGFGRVLMRIPAAIRDPAIAAGARLVVKSRTVHHHLVVKSVVGQFALDWLVDRYAPRVVLIQRHPLNIVSSWLTLPEPLYGLPENREVNRRVVAARGFPTLKPGSEHLQQVTWCIGLLTATLHQASQEHPDWLVVTHEHMCDDPVFRFRSLAAELGLRWDRSADRAVEASQRPGTGRITNRIASQLPERWRTVLSEREAKTVHHILEEFPGKGWIRSGEASTLMGLSSGRVSARQ